MSYCATCDGAFFRGRPVAVVGNNDEALKEALFLTKFASHIDLVVPTAAFKTSEAIVASIESAPNITMHFGARLLRVQGEQGRLREHIELSTTPCIVSLVQE